MRFFPDRDRPFVFSRIAGPRPRGKGRHAGDFLTARFATPAARIEFVAWLFCAIFVGLGVRLAFVMARAPDSQPARIRAIASQNLVLRAEIRDRDGQLLARSVATQSIIGTPSDIYDKKAAAAALAGAFPGLDEARILAQISSSRYEVRIKRHLDATETARFLGMGRGGFRLAPDVRRIYPGGMLAAHVLGYVGGDRGSGLAGIEAGLETRLAPGKAAPVQPAPLVLSLSSPVQAALESELGTAAKNWQARGAAGIILDSRTGEILALASWPAFDLNSFATADADWRRNRALTEAFEMGSVIKPFTYAAALEAGTLPGDAKFDTRGGVAVGQWQRRDPVPVGPGASIDDVLAVSSNVAAAQTALGLGGGELHAFFRRLGFEGTAGVETVEGFRAPALVSGDPAQTAVSGYGYSFQVNLVMLASAYGALANDGVRVLPTLVKRDPWRDPESVRVMSAATAGSVRSALREVVIRGTGKPAAVAGLDVIGKTGTAEKAVENGYDPNRRLASFAGIFPGFAPHYVVAILLDEPAGAEGEAGGAAAAAPLAARVIARAAPLLGISKQEPATVDEGNVQRKQDGESRRGL